VGVGGVLVLGLVAVLTPAALRTVRRRRRIAVVAAGGPGAAAAAWEEVLAESCDRGAAPTGSGSVRAVARVLAREHSLDEPGRSGLRSLVGALERSWYGPGAATDPNLAAALAEVRASLTRCAPTGRRAQLLPRSVLPPRRR
ncbi:MAG: transglutaminase domain-containing protein, partial [Actinomycetota bacterium]|nr:transglutaminase domain-containing protein [Actinomycetota bacterium]